MDIDLTQEITQEGLREVKLQAEALKIRSHVILDWQNWEASSINGSPDFLVYTYKSCIEFLVNIHIGLIVGMRFSQGYAGKLFGKVSIGDTVAQLKTVNEHIVFDEEFIGWDDGFAIEFELDNNGESISTLEEVENNRIVSITVSNRGLSSIFIATQQMPESWLEIQRERYQ